MQYIKVLARTRVDDKARQSGLGSMLIAGGREHISEVLPAIREVVHLSLSLFSSAGAQDGEDRANIRHESGVHLRYEGRSSRNYDRHSFR